MENIAYRFESITLLITHYNRSNSLQRLLSTFHSLDTFFGDIVVSDDGSSVEHLARLEQIRKIYPFRLITAQVNKGLGNNINKGQEAVTTPYTLYVQEDFEPTALFPEQLQNACKYIPDENIDLIRFYAYFRYPYLKNHEGGFSEMIFKFWYPGYYKFFQYSDHPHLRKSSFIQKFGRYVEGTNSDDAEYKMCLSFIKNKGKGLFYTNYNTLFEQVNTNAEPSTANFRKAWKMKQSIAIVFLRKLYLQYKFLKYNFDYLIFK